MTVADRLNSMSGFQIAAILFGTIWTLGAIPAALLLTGTIGVWTAIAVYVAMPAIAHVVRLQIERRIGSS